MPLHCADTFRWAQQLPTSSLVRLGTTATLVTALHSTLQFTALIRTANLAVPRELLALQ